MSNTTRHVEQDRHYWRHRGNLQVRKKRLTRKSARWIALVLFNGALVWAAYTACHQVVGMACSSPEFQLKDVELSGEFQTPRKELAEAIQPFIHRNLFTLDLNEIARAVEARPWVLRATVKRMLPCGIRIRIRERTAAALVRVNGQVQVVDTAGKRVPAAELAHPERFRTLPVFTGLDRADPARAGERIRRGLAALAALQEDYPDWAAEIASLDLERPDRIGVAQANSDVRILLDPENVLNNFGEYLALRERIRTRVGPVSYYDLRWRDRITLMPGKS